MKGEVKFDYTSGRRKYTVTGQLVSLSRNTFYGQSRSIQVELVESNVEETWMHDEPHFLEDRHYSGYKISKPLACYCKCERCYNNGNCKCEECGACES